MVLSWGFSLEGVAMKKIYKSKTFWVNVIGAVILTVSELSGLKFIPPETAAYILGGANLVLRVLTKVPVEW